MRTLIECIHLVHACRTHADLVHLFEQHGGIWRRQLIRSEHRTLVRHARERGRALEGIENECMALQHFGMEAPSTRQAGTDSYV